MCPSPFSGAFIAIQVPKPRSFKSTIGVHCLESMRPLVPADARSRSGIATSGSNVMRPFEDFEALAVQVEETHIFLRRFGSGPAVLLLHGFPQTHLMWRSVAPLLARRFTVICADLRGYGKSGCPASAPDHAPYAKRAMAKDMVSVMEKLGFPRFCVAGHDRGGRGRVSSCTRSPGASGTSRCSRHPSDRRHVGAGR
jgi:hypothetical protein